ncbi:MAG: NIPSNAP family containing protein [Chloroflexi bacterium]|nr:MAG: NIPSNAP family containing protein [Chloroflexota bacterium]
MRTHRLRGRQHREQAPRGEPDLRLLQDAVLEFGGVHQLRIYTIKQGEMAAWISEWKSLIAPLRRKFGFEVVGAWTVDEERFIWVLHYDGPKSWEEVDAEYYNSEERKAIDPDPARHIEKSEHFLMREVR